MVPIGCSWPIPTKLSNHSVKLPVVDSLLFSTHWSFGIKDSEGWKGKELLKRPLG